MPLERWLAAGRPVAALDTAIYMTVSITSRDRLTSVPFLDNSTFDRSDSLSERCGGYESGGTRNILEPGSRNVV
jgi:hypothetical protein